MTPNNCRTPRICWWLLPIVAMIAMATGSAFAGDQKDMGGWELDSPYNK
jgi:hypothetical protein